MDEEEVSLITDEHRAKIGVKSEPVPMKVKAADFRFVRDALGDKDPRYADDTGVAAPYALSILEPRPVAGLSRDFVPWILPSGILTQSEWTVHRPIKVEEPLTVQYQVMDLRERLGGRFGRSALVILHAEYRAEDGELVAETNHTVTQFDPAGAKS